MAKATSAQVSVASTETRVMASVSSMFDFARTQVESMLNEANNRGLVELDQRNLTAVVNLVNASISDSFVKSSGEVITILETLDK
jgi:squalene cyclase